MYAYPGVAIQAETAHVPPMEARRTKMKRSAMLQSFDAIALPEMGRVELLRRTDTKYLLGEDQFFHALARLTDHYRILEIEERRLQHYQTLYFDTWDWALYRQHHDGWHNRYKVRKRVYVDSDLSFLEIKHKTDDRTTIKSRMPGQGWSAQIPPAARAFLHEHYPYRAEELEPKLGNTFQRITLVSTERIERVTIDLDLCLVCNSAQVRLDGIAVAEVKQDRFSVGSEFVQQMRLQGVRATRFSKYCIGVSMLYPEVKHNLFKPQLRRIDQLGQKRIPCQTLSSY